MIKIVTTFSKWHFREVLEETGYNIGEKIDPDQYSEQILNDQVCDFFKHSHEILEGIILLVILF